MDTNDGGNHRTRAKNLVGLLVGLLFLAAWGPRPMSGSDAASKLVQPSSFVNAPGPAAADIDAERKTAKPRQRQIVGTLGEMPLYFIENRGQMDKRVHYYIQGADKTIYFTSAGVTYALRSASKRKASSSATEPPGFRLAAHTEMGRSGFGPEAAMERWAVKLDFMNADPDVAPKGLNAAGATISYFRGPKAGRKTGIPTFAGLVYEDLWPGIDLVYSGTVTQLKYTFHVKPKADPSQIELAYRGAKIVLGDTGRLDVTTPVGGFQDDRPYAFQNLEGARTAVDAAYTLKGRRRDGSQLYGFWLGDYDPDRELVLDPAVIVYAGYIGGAGDDEGNDIAVDADGNVYVAGTTTSSAASFPAIAGPDLTWGGGNDCGFIGRPDACPDAFVAKVDAAGNRLIYAGYIGGSGSDNATGIAIDSAGNAYVSGTTNSSQASFPVTVGPDLTHNGPAGTFGLDVFVAKVNSTGTALVYAGYIGGAEVDQGNDIAVDGAGNAYITGITNSKETSFPVRVGPDLTHNGASGLSSSAFVAKVNAAGTALDYAGYIGGSTGDFGMGIAVDGAGNAYVTGSSSSKQDFPVVVGPDLTLNGADNCGLFPFQDAPCTDAFVAKVNAAGTGFIYAGFIGGMSTDVGVEIAVDSSGSAYVMGHTASDESSFPARIGPDLTFNGATDAFVAKVNPAGTDLVYAGYIGGDDAESKLVDFSTGGIAVDAAGSAYITGITSSSADSFRVFNGPDLTFNGGGSDAFVAKVNPTGTALLYAGFIGGSGADEGRGIAVDAAGNAYVGCTTTSSSGFPVRGGPDLTFNGTMDAFVAKVGEGLDVHEITDVLDGAGFRGLISPGSIVSVFGDFTEQTATAIAVPLDTNLGGFSVTFNGIPGPLFGVFGDDFGLGFNQANVQLPWEVDISSGTIEVRVHREGRGADISSEGFQVDAAQASPGIFTFDFGPGRAIVQNLDGSFAQPSGSLRGVVTRPAEIGQAIIVWSNGLGAVNPPGVSGDAPGLDAPLSETTKAVTLFIDGVEAQILGRPVLHPTLVGLNQINAIVPAGITPGDEVQIQIEVDCGDGKVFRSREDVTIAAQPAQ